MGISASYDQTRLLNITVAQYDTVSRQQLLDCGMTSSAIQHRVRPGGAWQAIVPGIYAVHSGPVSAIGREMAAILHAGSGAMITGAFALRHYGLAAPGPDYIEVLVPLDNRKQSVRFIRLIHTGRLPGTAGRIGAIPLAPKARAVADAARSYRQLNEARTVVCGALERGLGTAEELGAELRNGPKRGSANFRQALLEATEGIWSAAEGEFAALIGRSSLEQPRFNMGLFTEEGEFLGIVDAWWQRAGVAAEVDSQERHFSRAEWLATMKRHNVITKHRIQLMHFAPCRIKSEQPDVIAELGAAIAAGTAAPPLPIRAIPGAEALAELRQLRNRHR
jgi:hypothetical protein